MQKRCKTCQQVKSTDQFWKRTNSRDGFDYDCKTCQAARLKAYWEANPEKLLAKRRKLKDRNAQLVKKYRTEHPERIAAGEAFKQALRKGIVKPEPCRVCGDAKTEGHHPDYSHPIDVVWLCRKHHREVHAMARALEKTQ